MEDKRFVHIATDPKFKNIRKADKKVKIDKRFQSMFKDKKFKVNYSVDKRGKVVNQTSNSDLRRYYHLSSEESDSEDKEQSDETVESKNEVNDDLYLKDKSDKEVSNDIKRKLKDLAVDYARGESKLLSESSSDDEETDSEVSDDEDKVEHKWGELDADAERTEESTCRLAACNMDWDRIRAIDLMVLLNSFVPQGGLIKSVTIYPSEYGKQRMKEEELKGPIELVENKIEDEGSPDENEEGSKYHMEKLREYQLNRLKYYYAVIVCDSLNTANKIYTECDGMEYESSATKIDLRFIPDDLVFDEEPKEVCEKLPDMTKYQPRFFTTTALQQAKVDLTWDETNPERVEITQKLAKGKLDEIAETDLQNYLASSSDENEQDSDNENNEDKLSDNEEGGGNPIDKYRALLNEIENKEKEKDKDDVQVEITWGIDLEEKAEKLVKSKMENKEEKTPFQKYLDKRKEKRKEKKQQHKDQNKSINSDHENSDDSDIPSDIDMNDPYFAEEFDKPEFKKEETRKRQNLSKSDKKATGELSDDNQNQAELELLLMNEDDSKKHFNLKKIQENETESKSKKKRNKKKSDGMEKADDFEVNVRDERFSALYTSHHFNIDPSDPHYKKTKGMERIINEKLKRRQEEDETNVPKKSKHELPKRSAELNVLVKSVKRKAEALKNKTSK